MADERELYLKEIPEAARGLGQTHLNLMEVANYCDTNYKEAEDKRVAFEVTRNYTAHSLASVAGQVDMVAQKFIEFLDLQQKKLDETQSELNYLSQIVIFHDEKIARREIANTVKRRENTLPPPETKQGVLFPKQIEKPVKYIRTPIDYSIYDNCGHGMLVVNSTSTAKRTSSFAGRRASPCVKPLSSNMSGYATIGPFTRSHHRTIASPVAPMSPSLHQKFSHQPSSSVAYYDMNPYRSDKGRSIDNLQIRAPTISQGLTRELDLARITDPTQDYPVNQTPTGIIQIPPPVLVSPSASEENFPPPPLENLLPSSENYFEPFPDYDKAVDENPYARTTQVIESAPQHFIEKVVAIYDYTAAEVDELTFQENSVIYVLKKNDNGWWEGIMNGKQGLFPSNYVAGCV